MKRLIIFDFDGTLIDSPEPNQGKKIWKEKTGQEYPYIGWWGRKESLDTNVFDIKPFPNVLAKLEEEKSVPDTKVIILTSRREKLRPQLENILNLNNIVVDDIILKRGNEGKGDVILKIENYNQDLEEIIVYDDYMEKNAEKIAEYTKIKNLLTDKVKYTLYFVDNGNISLLLSGNKMLDIINEEVRSLFTSPVDEPKTIYHGADIENLRTFVKNPEILSPEEKRTLPSNTGGNLIGMSTSTNIDNAKKYSRGFGHSHVLKMELLSGAKTIQIDTQGNGIDNIFTNDDLEKFQNQGIDAIIELDDRAESEVRILNPDYLKVIGIV